MKEIIVHPLPYLTTELRDIPIPTPADDELVIKVVVAGSNVKDWAHITTLKMSVNSGDDVSGIVHAMGAEAAAAGEFKIGDRVAGFHKMLEPAGAYAEYAVVPTNTAFIIPQKTSFEEAATIPLVTLTASISLFRRQCLPAPWSPFPPSNTSTPLIIYGASSALGCFTIKLASLSHIHPIIAICGSSKDYVCTLLDDTKGDKVVDYRQGTDAWKAEVKGYLIGKSPPLHAIDAISANGTWVPISQILADLSGSSTSPQVSVVSGAAQYTEAEIPPNVDIKYTYVGTAHYGAYKVSMPKQPSDKDEVKADIEFAWVLMRYVARMLTLGKFSGHPYEVIPGGLRGVEQGLNKLKAGEAKGKKFVYRIQETKDL